MTPQDNATRAANPAAAPQPAATPLPADAMIVVPVRDVTRLPVPPMGRAGMKEGPPVR